MELKSFYKFIKYNIYKISPLIKEIIMDLSFHKDIIYFPVNKIVVICSYDNGDDIPDEIQDLALYIRDEFNACEVGDLDKSRDELVKKLQE